MRSITVAVAALLVVLAGSGLANASVLTLSITLDKTQIYTSAGDGAIYATYTVWGTITGNDWQDTLNDIVLNGGLATWEVGVSYASSNGGQARAYGFAATTNARPTFDTHWGTAQFLGSVINPAGVPTENGTGGTIKTFAADAGFAYPEEYQDNEAKFEYGNGAVVKLFSTRIYAVATGTVTLTTVGYKPNVLVYSLENESKLRAIEVTSIVNGSSPPLTINTPSSNQPPVLDSVNPLSVAQNDWSKEPGWNNPAHTVTITAAGHDPDSGPSPLSFKWVLTNPNAGGTSHQLGATTAVLNLTIGEIATLFPGELPASDKVAGYLYNWDLAVQAYDGPGSGAAYSATTMHVPVYVPEPATIGLLSFGIVGALLRRRRRA